MASYRASMVLLVEDDDDTRQMLSALLLCNGYQVRTAETGSRALQLAEQHPPDVVLLDIGLPDLDGELIALTLRQRLGRSVVIIALTGWPREALVTAADTGFDHVLTKPIGMEDIERLLPAL